jgi:uncharacterized protein
MSEIMQLVASKQEDKVDIDLYVTDDNLAAFIAFERIDSGAITDLGILHTLLEENGIVYGVNLKQLKGLVKLLNGGQIQADGERFVVAEGKSPFHGKDGFLDFHVSPSIKNPKFDVEENEVIDYRNTSLISNVMLEQHLVTLMEAQEPQEGIDIFGVTVSVSEPQPLKYILGQGVFEDGNKIHASVNGMFVYEDNHLSVSPLYEVLGNVDFTVGNINFVGKVTVSKDVLDDFSISGSEGVEVQGVVGAANIESNADVLLVGGINGQNKSFVKAQGNIEAKYLNEIDATTWGDVKVNKSMINSQVKSKGVIDMPDGSIIGGEVYALKGIEVGTLGSDLGILTDVNIGIDYEYEERKKAYEVQLKNIEIEIERIDRNVQPYIVNQQSMKNVSPNKKRLIISMLQKSKTLKEEKKMIFSNLDNIGKKLFSENSAELVVKKMLYSGVKVRVGRFKRTIKMEIKGPIILKEDPENNSVMIAESI